MRFSPCSSLLGSTCSFGLQRVQVNTSTPLHTYARVPGLRAHVQQQRCLGFFWIRTTYVLSGLTETSYSLSFPSLSPLVNIPPLFLTSPFIEPSVRSHRRLGFRVCPHTNATHRIDAPRDECIEHSRYDRWGRGDILCLDINVPPPDRDYVRCGEGGFFCTNARV